MFEEDLSALSKDELEEELAAQAAHIDAGLSRLLALAVECEQRLSVGGDGVTFAQWLAWRCSLLPRQAREHERIGKRLTELPLIQSAFARGELSYGKVSVLTRIAEPETEERLVELAEVMTASQLQRCVAPLPPATAAAVSRAARTRDSSTATTSSTGAMAAKPISTT